MVVLENGPVDTVFGAGKTSRDILQWIAQNRPQYAEIRNEDPKPNATTTEEVETGLEEGVTPL